VYNRKHVHMFNDGAKHHQLKKFIMTDPKNPQMQAYRNPPMGRGWWSIHRNTQMP
jgi:hypothetical protein